MIYKLSEEHSDCLLLNYAIQVQKEISLHQTEREKQLNAWMFGLID
jgi:hypothetical protein